LPWKEVEKLLGIDRPMEQRIREAKKLMKEAGYPDGFKAEMISRNQPPYLRPAEFMMEGWRKHLGIQVELKPMENAVLFPRRDTGDFDLIYDGMTGRLGGSPEESLGMFVSQAEENHGKWTNIEYGRLLVELIREMDSKKKAEKSVRMQQIFLGEVPFIINVTPVIGTAYRANLHGHVMQTGHTGWACWDRVWMEK
jgi:ABC-type transport system substrate-binding protein